jgi:amino acid adenylation domain-containing protein
MLGAHPRLFAPPELELLSFQTLAGREAAFPGRDRFWLEGVLRAVMEARSCDAAEAERIIAAATAEGWTTRRFYRELQGWIGDRLLVDKTPSYALDPAVLRRGEAWFAEARYVHLLRHPQATNRSFEEARLDQIFFRRPHRFTRRQLAELIWTVSHRNVLDFLAEIPPARRHTVRFEDLVRNPERVLAGLCGFLGLDFDPAMADPYREGAARMADGVHAESRMLGDVKFLAHGRVDAAAAERWRQAGVAPLGEPARQLAAELRYAEGGEGLSLVPLPRDGAALPLSFAQQRLWFLDRLQPGTPTYNIPSFFRLLGHLDPGLLERVLGELVRRHESLRTTFEELHGEPRQRVHPPAPPRVPRVDLSGLPELPETLRAAEVRRLARDEAGRGFSLEQGPLLRATLLRLDEEEHVLLTTVHHIVSDGWSTGVMAREVSALYDAFRRGIASPLPELPVQYADFAVWQRRRLSGAALDGELSFWRRRLEGLPGLLPLPTDRPRPPVQGFRGALTPLVLGPGLSADLAALGRRERTTPFMTLLAAFEVLLGRVTGQERFGVGTPAAGRNRVEIEPLIGFFVNTLVLRAELSGEPDFFEVLGRVREEALTAQVHQELPFEKLVEGLEIERSLSHTPLFQVMFAFQNASDARLDLPGLSLVPLEIGGAVAKFDLGLTLGGDAGGLAGAFDFSTDLFDETTIRRLAGHFRILLDALAADPGRKVWDAPLLAPAESHQILAEWNDTGAPHEAQLLHRLVEEQAARTPGAVAIEAGDVRRTYAELIEQARRFAEGVAPGTIVALAAERTPELIVQMLGVLQAGAAYLPVDPAYPEGRRAYILADARAKDLRDLKDVKDESQASFESFTSLRSFELSSGSAAYVLYTSGSTGRPKGVVVPHRAIASFVLTARETYGIGPGDRVLQFASLGFDTSGEEIWPALAAGATLVLRSEEMISSIPHFVRELERLEITVLDLPTAFWHEMVLGMETGGLELPRTLRLVIIGGEEALADRLALWQRRAGPFVRLVNTYGPTETTIVATRRELSGLPAGGTVPIGRPIPGVRAYVLDRFLAVFTPTPPGVRGELWIGGSGVARGYLGRPDLTADRFRPDPFVPGARLYRTGDLAFLRPDGDLVFAGRADRQVKLRGYRIEPGEIEAALVALPGVREAAVVLLDDRLVAYVASDLSADALRQALRERLPDYMVPAVFVTLAALPLTPNGKLDRKALLSQKATPEAPRADEGFRAPRTPVEETLAGLFVEILGTERTGGRVGVQDSFFDLGGHSLLATRLVAAVRDVFRVDLPLRLVFERPTVEGLAQALSALGEEGAPVDEPVVAILRGPGANRFPVSFAQLREWILDRLEPGNPAYNIAGHLRIEGPLSVPALTGALRGLVRRHEVFRTAFVAGEDEPLQVVFPEARLDVPVIDLSALPEGSRETELRRCVREEDGTGFDLSAAPLLRARVVRLGPEDHALLLTVHHIVSDGWSMSLLNQELAALYEGAAMSSWAKLPELPVQYADYAVWLRRRLSGEILEKQAAFWRQRLTGAPPLLELPTDRPRPPVRGSRGGQVPILLPQPLAGRLGELARRHGASLFMVLLAGYQTLLARWSGQDDIVVGTYSGNRPRRELEGLIGFFISTLVLRTRLTSNAGGPSFSGLIRRVRETTLEAYAHRDVPFEKLLEILQLPRDPSRTPLFQALLVLQNFPPAEADLSPGVRLSGLGVEREKSDYDLALWLGEGPEGLAGMLQYSTDLFDEATIVRFAGHLRSLLEAAVANPERNVWALPLRSAEEQARQLEAWSRGPAVPAGPFLLHRLVEEQAARTPDAVAIEAGSLRLTYAELVEQARRFAQGVSPGAIVALAAERTPELIVQMLGVLQAGAAYLPIDPVYPRERREHMVADSGAKDLKDSKDSNDRLSSLLSLETLPSLDFPPEISAYLIYTSGSTGRPKGVVVPHDAIASFVRSAIESYDLAPADRVLQFASLSFDTSAEEIWPALASGATLVLRPEEMAASIPHFLRELDRLDVTVLDLPTAFWHELVAGLDAEEIELPRGLRLVILGGEEALADRFALWRRRAGSAVRLVNTYGPTETTIVATRCDLSDLSPGGLVPIGRPIPGARAYVLDRFLALVPPGVRGELWIGGAGVARGYLGRPELTAERFLPDPFPEEPGARLYRTGDLAVLRPDGDLVFAGRADRQLKIRGYRIEPGEVEAALRLHPAVRDAVVDARGPGDGRRLIAWIVPREGSAGPEASELRAFLRARLPDPLVPGAFAVLSELPLTPGGKVDRRALQEPAEARPEGMAWVEPRSALERVIAEIYRDLLRVSRIGLHDNFFDLGGHSLLIVRAHQKLKAALGREIPVLDLFRFPTVAALARHLGGEEAGSLRKVQGLADQQRAAQQRQKAALEGLRRPGGPGAGRAGPKAR